MKLIANALGFEGFTPKQKAYLMGEDFIEWDRQEGKTIAYTVNLIMNLEYIPKGLIGEFADMHLEYYKRSWFVNHFTDVVTKLQEAKLVDRDLIR